LISRHDLVIKCGILVELVFLNVGISTYSLAKGEENETTRAHQWVDEPLSLFNGIFEKT
jgi:hypothetical protein